MGTPNEFIEFIDIEIRRKGWNISDLARASGIHAGTISNILNGSRKPGPEVCNALAKVFKVPPSVLFVKAGLMDEDPEDEVSSLSREAMSLFNSLSDENKKHVLAYIKFLSFETRPEDEA